MLLMDGYMYGKILTLTLTLLFIPALSATVIYKWVDENGVTHYSQQIPEDSEQQNEPKKLYSEDIEPKVIGTVAPTIRQEKKEQSQAQQDAALINEQDQEQAKEICKSAKHNLNILLTHTRINNTDDGTGVVTALTEEQRQQRITLQKQRIKLFCK